jgi:hypothetical protein
MKLKLLYLLCFLGTFKIEAQVFEVQTLKLSGDTDKRINLVILSEGYQTSEFPQFITDATSFINAMFSQSPFLEYANYFNVYAIKVPSNQSGSDHPGTATDVAEPASPITIADTYFNTSYDSYDIHRLLYSSDYASINTVLANNFPAYDQALILVNSSVYGGSGGQFPFTSTGASASEIAIHELGHSLFNLKDEYYPGDALAAEAINMTQETNTSLVKWKNWIGINNIGIYPYATSGNAANWNRPDQNCKMRYLGVPFCSVCKEGIVEKIHSLVSPFDSYTPTSNSISSPTFPIDFHLNLITPIPNTLKRTWTLNATNFANDVDDVSVLETDLSPDINTLTVAVNDVTTFLKVDNHNSFHVYTVNWTIDNSALGIKNIISEVAKYNISMYPNPTNTVVNFKLETDTDTRLKVDILSLDGKKIKTISLTNYQTNQVDISNLSSGIYLTNFYSGNTLITSKKLVKN